MPPTSTTRPAPTWDPAGVVVRAFAFATLSGALCGVGFLLVLFLGDAVQRPLGRGPDPGELVGVLLIYFPVAMFLGGCVGLVVGIVVGTGLCLAGSRLFQHLGAARVLAATLAVTPAVLALRAGVDGVVVLGCSTAAALGAAFWTRRILGMVGA